VPIDIRYINNLSADIYVLELAAAAYDIPWRFTNIKAHPERDPKRKDNPTIEDIAIYMVDVAAD
jgi:hypothetical protein